MDVHSPSQKAKRTRAKGEALNILKTQFNVNPNPSLQDRNRISELTGMPEKNVRIWFQNRRAKVRKKDKNDHSHDGKQNSNSASNSANHTPHMVPTATATVTANNNNNINNNTTNPSTTTTSASTTNNTNNIGGNIVGNGIAQQSNGYMVSNYSNSNSGINNNGAGRNTTSTTDVATADSGTPPYFDKIPLNLNNNYYFIDVFSITVGSWNRMKSGALNASSLPVIKDFPNLSPISMNQLMANATDLMVVISKKNFEINYFFSAMANNTKILFRIFFRINTIASCSLSFDKTDEEINDNKPTDPLNKLGELKLKVNKPPKFAVFFLNQPDSAANNQWCLCDDFSEGKQVNDAFVGGSNIPHILKGLQGSLKVMNSLILDYISTNDTVANPPLPLPPTMSSDMMHPQIHPAQNMMAYTGAIPGQLAPHPSDSMRSLANAGGSISPAGYAAPYATLPHIQTQPSMDSQYFMSQYNPQPMGHDAMINGHEPMATYDPHHMMGHPPMPGMIPNPNPIITGYSTNPMENMLVGVHSVNNSDNMLAFTNESGISNTPDFLRNTSEVNEENRWI
ncbi:Regulatory protein PHO2 [Nakaseomyces bracarensis]|uniref:Regulatory protein PHO2 n=1 Tax=Nakaseomyces bracarensis TaxID=273131 RepID=A0ABR4NPR7_9SACH